jgi:hypothetical protein
MQKINPLLAKASKTLARPSKDSQTEAGQTEHEPKGDSGPDRVDAINQLFAEFEIAYHNQYYKAYNSEERLVLAKKYWLNCLVNYAPAQIVAAARHVVKTHDFLPTVSVVVRACEDGASVFGLPSPREAYVEACRAPSPKSGAKWSHEAVYFAGKSTGWFLLASEPEDRVYPLFQYYYHALCQRVMRGEALATPQPPALNQHISKPLSGEENHARMKKMREELGL